MPGRKAHRVLTSLAAGASTPIFFVAPIEVSLPFFLGVVVTMPLRFKVGPGEYIHVYFNPDMDTAGENDPILEMFGLNSYQEGVVHRRGLRLKDWKGLPKKPWSIFWFSHLPLIGTLPRFLLLTMPIAVVFLMTGLFEHLTAIMIFSFLFGMSTSDAVHVLADITWSAIRKLFR